MKIERKLKNCFNLKDAFYLLLASFDQDVLDSTVWALARIETLLCGRCNFQLERSINEH